MRAIVHKFKCHSDDEAVMFVEESVDSPYCVPISNIKYYQMPNVYEIARYSQTSGDDIKKYTEEQIDNFFEKAGMEPNEFSSIYVMYDSYNPFILYFEIKKINYVCAEGSDNVFLYFYQGRNVLERPKEEYIYNCLIRDMHLQDGQGEYCIKSLYFSEKSTQVDGTTPKEVFGYYDTLLSLPEEQKRQLIDALRLENYDIDAVMLFNSPGLTERGIIVYEVNIPEKYKTYENVHWFYKVILDYYFSKVDFYLKLHPLSDEYFKKSFESFRQIPKHITVELFAILNKNFKIYCPIESTSVGIFEKLGYDITFFGFPLVNFFKYIHFTYLAFDLIKSTGHPQKIIVYGIDIEQLNYFKTWAYKDFKDVEFENLNINNVKSANHIIAEPDAEFTEIIKDTSKDCLIIANGDYKASDSFARQKMIYSIIDMSEAMQIELQQFNWTVLSKKEEVLYSARRFCASYILEHSKTRIQSVPFIDSTEVDYKKEIAVKLNEYENLRFRERNLLYQGRFMQLCYESEIAGFSILDYLKENNLFSSGVKLAFFAVDEFGVIIYRICQRLGIEFSVLVSDIDRKITYHTHQNLTETLTLKSMDKVDKSSYTNIFMATIWNQEQIDYVRGFCPELLVFHTVLNGMYTRAFLIDKIALIKERNPEVKIGMFFTPYVHQIPGEHSELEEYFIQQGSRMSNILHIQDEAMREKAKELCYRSIGFDDNYIESVCNVDYTITSYNGVYLLSDCESKYVNIVNHRRVTTDNPENFENTIYFFGDRCVAGLHVGDSETIESNLQRIINKNGLPYIVQNCANMYGAHYDWIFTLIDTVEFKPGDILLFCAPVDWLTEQYIKQNNKTQLSNILSINTTSVFRRPHDHGELFTDDHHFNAKGYGLIAQKIFDDLKAADFFNTDKKPNDLIDQTI